MHLELNSTGTLKFGDNSTARVEIVKIETYKYLPTDYWFKYVDGETNRQLSYDIDKEKFPLPYGLVIQVYTPDIDDRSEYEVKLEQYLEKHIRPEDREEASYLFYKLSQHLGEEKVINEYFNKDGKEETH